MRVVYQQTQGAVQQMNSPAPAAAAAAAAPPPAAAAAAPPKMPRTNKTVHRLKHTTLLTLFMPSEHEERPSSPVLMQR